MQAEDPWVGVQLSGEVGLARISDDGEATETLNLLPAMKVLPETRSDFRQGIPLEDTKNI